MTVKIESYKWYITRKRYAKRVDKFVVPAGLFQQALIISDKQPCVEDQCNNAHDFACTVAQQRYKNLRPQGHKAAFCNNPTVE